MKKLILLFCLYVLSLSAAPAQAGEVFDRVMKSGTLRCGYAMWPPMMYMDVNSGELKGVAHDLTEELGKKLDLKIEWSEEVNWGNIIEGLVTNRYDMFCTGMGVNSPRAKRMSWTTPFAYSALYAVVNEGETTLTKNADLNSADVKISVLEGEAGALAAQMHFPEAQFVAIPQLAELPQTFQEVIQGKANATVIDHPTFADFNKANPGNLKLLDPQAPVSVLAIAQGVRQDDEVFKNMLNASMGELMNDGTFDRILDKYPETRNVFLLPTKPYEASK
jgi:polar amino acid transport system substrate-binding protein